MPVLKYILLRIVGAILGLLIAYYSLCYLPVWGTGERFILWTVLIHIWRVILAYFFLLLLWFTVEAFLFHRRKKIALRNTAIVLALLALIPIVVFLPHLLRMSEL